MDRIFKDRVKNILNHAELMEKLADIEHKRWSGWQKYLHGLCTKNKDGSLTISKDRVEHWEWEIATSYFDLPDNIKQHDRNEVEKTLKCILDYMNNR